MERVEKAIIEVPEVHDDDDDDDDDEPSEQMVINEQEVESIEAVHVLEPEKAGPFNITNSQLTV